MPRLRELHGFDVVTPFLGACDRCGHTVTEVRVVASTIAPMRAPDQECADRARCDRQRAIATHRYQRPLVRESVLVMA